MYNNYGDPNFFEYGRMAELQNDGTVNMLVFDCKNPDRCYELNGSRIEVYSYPDITRDDIIQKEDLTEFISL